MEDANNKLRHDVLCAMARQNCIAMLETRNIFDNETVASFCEFISTLCVKLDDAACKDQSRTCADAARALRRGDTKKYLELCRLACATCPFTQKKSGEEQKVIQ